MTDFKVGDRVRVVNLDDTMKGVDPITTMMFLSKADDIIGLTGTITDIDNGFPPISIDLDDMSAVYEIFSEDMPSFWAHEHNLELE